MEQFKNLETIRKSNDIFRLRKLDNKLKQYSKFGKFTPRIAFKTSV